MSPTASAVAELTGCGNVPFAGRLVRPQADPVPIAWAVENLAARETLTVLAAPTATGKTWLALQLAAATREGANVAGLQCHPGRALYLDAENGPSIIGRRLHEAHQEDGFSTVDYIDARGLRLDTDAGQTELADAIAHYGSTFVVLDSLRRLAPGSREDSSDSMAPLLGALADVARQTGAAILLQHHRSTKGRASAVRGSSAIEDQADAVFALSRTKDPSLRRLTAIKYRLAREPKPLALRWRDDPPGFTPAAVVEGGRQAEVSAAVNALAANVAADGSWTTSRLAEAVGLDAAREGERKLFGRVMADLVDTGVWTRPVRGSYAPSRRSVTAEAPGDGTWDTP